jgi:hypothetical protein
MTFARRLALRHLAAGETLADLDTDEVILPLVQAGLVGAGPRGYTLTELGRTYLTETRKLPRPGPPALPPGWSSKGTHYSFRGRLVRGYGTPHGEVVMMTRECEPGLDMRDVQLECAQAHLDFVTYIRALVAHNKRARVVTHAGSAPLAAGAVGVTDGGARPQELSYEDGGAR